jgi:hypothetical protein
MFTRFPWVLDRARLLLVDLGLEQIADDALRFVLAFDGGGGHDLVEGGFHVLARGCERAEYRSSCNRGNLRGL